MRRRGKNPLLLWLFLAGLVPLVHSVTGQLSSAKADAVSVTAVTTSTSSTTTTTTTTTTSVQMEIRCLNGDCNGEGAPGRVKPGGLIAMHMISTTARPDTKPDDDVVTSVPRKEVNEEEVQSIPKKGVSDLLHNQSIKKEIKELEKVSSTTATSRGTTTTTTTTPRSVETPALKETAEPARLKPAVTTDEEDVNYTESASSSHQTASSISLAVGVVFGLVLMAVLFFVGLKRLEALRRRREYRRMNDFLIEGMYNDL